MSDPESKRMVLGIEESSGRLSEERGDRLFENRQPTPFLNEALTFCADFNRQWEDSLTMLRAFQDAGILVEDDREIELGETQSLKLGGFLVVDEQRLSEVSEGVFLAWREKGWLAPLYAHLASRQNWPDLAQAARMAG